MANHEQLRRAIAHFSAIVGNGLKRLLKLSSFRKPNRPLVKESTLSSSYLLTANKA